MAMSDITKTYVPTIVAIVALAGMAGAFIWVGKVDTRVDVNALVIADVKQSLEQSMAMRQQLVQQQAGRDLAQDQLINANSTNWGRVEERLNSIDRQLTRIETAGKK